MKYDNFLDKKSPRTKTLRTIHHLNIYMTSIEKDRIEKALNGTEDKIYGGYFPDEESQFLRRTNDEIRFDFSIYLRNKYYNLSKSEKEILVSRSKKSITMFLFVFSNILRNEESIQDENYFYLNDSDIIRYKKLKQQNEIMDFFKALECGMMYISNELLAIDKLIEEENMIYISTFEANLGILFRFYSFQYEAILLDILYSNTEQKEQIDKNNSIYKYGKANALIFALQGLPAFDMFMKALKNQLIEFIEEEDKFNFNLSTPVIWHLLEKGEFKQWKILREFALVKGDTIPESIKSSNTTKESNKLVKLLYNS